MGSTADIPSKVRGRFAPSPTGDLHLGNARTALLAWQQARRASGVFILRIEDIDPVRMLRDGARAIIDDLAWLGLNWDEGPGVGGPHAPYDQGLRREFYRSIFETWKKEGRVYPCTCSRKDLALATAPHDGEEGPRYPGTCRDGTRERGRPPAWRFRLPPDSAVTFDDRILGPQRQDVSQQCGDFPVWRNDDWPTYQLAVVADDAAMGVTDVVRGADLLGSVGRQTLLFQALGKLPPRWHHVPLWLDDAGERLAKRNPSQTLTGLRASGWTPERVLARIAASLGWTAGESISAAELLDPRFTLPTEAPHALIGHP